MANRRSPVHEARRLGRWQLLELGREVRVARISSGRTLAEVGRLVGRSAAWMSRLEHGQITSLSVVDAGRVAAAVGLRLSVRLYPGGRRVLDEPQLRLLARFNARIHPGWKIETEVPMPIAGDLRAADQRLSLAGQSVVVEALTRFVDFQAQSRAALLKKRDVQADRLILLIGASTANREGLRRAGPVIRESFSIGTKAALRSLANGQPPPTDAIVVL
jgi:transcriptional regulator with XRE-family HTH domain